MPALGPIISSLVGNSSPLAATSRLSMKCLAESSSAFPHLRVVVRHANYVTHYTLISGKIEISNLFDFVTRRISVFRHNSRHGAQDPYLPQIGPHHALRMDDCCHRPVHLHVPCMRAEKKLSARRSAGFGRLDCRWTTKWDVGTSWVRSHSRALLLPRAAHRWSAPPRRHWR